MIEVLWIFFAFFLMFYDIMALYRMAFWNLFEGGLRVSHCLKLVMKLSFMFNFLQLT